MSRDTQCACGWVCVLKVRAWQQACMKRPAASEAPHRIIWLADLACPFFGSDGAITNECTTHFSRCRPQ